MQPRSIISLSMEIYIRSYDDYATFFPFCSPPPPLDLFLSLSPLELELELSAPPSVSLRCLLTSGFAGLTSRGLFVSCTSMDQRSSDLSNRNSIGAWMV